MRITISMWKLNHPTVNNEIHTKIHITYVLGPPMHEYFFFYLGLPKAISAMEIRESEIWPIVQARDQHCSATPKAGVTKDLLL